jgi:hypothetical protein
MDIVITKLGDRIAGEIRKLDRPVPRATIRISSGGNSSVLE